MEEGAGGALVVGIFIEDDFGGFEVALDVVGDLAVVVVSVDKLGGVVFGDVHRGSVVRVATAAGFFGELGDEDDGADEERDDDNERD